MHAHCLKDLLGDRCQGLALTQLLWSGRTFLPAEAAKRWALESDRHGLEPQLAV